MRRIHDAEAMKVSIFFEMGMSAPSAIGASRSTPVEQEPCSEPGGAS
jgi:hypothetical protein